MVAWIIVGSFLAGPPAQRGPAAPESRIAGHASHRAIGVPLRRADPADIGHPRRAA
jgi:hypothetical protein